MLISAFGRIDRELDNIIKDIQKNVNTDMDMDISYREASGVLADMLKLNGFHREMKNAKKYLRKKKINNKWTLLGSFIPMFALWYFGTFAVSRYFGLDYFEWRTLRAGMIGPMILFFLH